MQMTDQPERIPEPFRNLNLPSFQAWKSARAKQDLPMATAKAEAEAEIVTADALLTRLNEAARDGAAVRVTIDPAAPIATTLGSVLTQFSGTDYFGRAGRPAQACVASLHRLLRRFELHVDTPRALSEHRPGPEPYL